MYLVCKKIRIIFMLSFFSTVMISCIWGEKNESSPRIESRASKNRFDYSGGEVYFVAHYPHPIRSSQRSWRTGKANVLRSIPVYNSKGLMSRESLWVDWDEMAYQKIDSIFHNEELIRIDTLHFDSISVSVDGRESPILLIQLLNMGPYVNEVVLHGRRLDVTDRIINLPAHRGEKLKFGILLRNESVQRFKTQIKIPDHSEIRFLSETDSIVWMEWAASRELMNDTIVIDFGDSRGASRSYQVHRFTYNETGSVWVGAGNEMIKVSEYGQEIFRLDSFRQVQDIHVYANRHQIWVTDYLDHSLSLLKSDGSILWRDTSQFNKPEWIKIDPQADWIWVVDRTISNIGRLRRYSWQEDELISDFEVLSPNGPIGSFSVSSFYANLSWVVYPEADEIHKVSGEDVQAFGEELGVNRPAFVRIDHQNSNVWIADSASITLLSANGDSLAKIRGFSFISGLDVGGGTVCVSDARKNEVLLFKTSLRGNKQTFDGIVLSGFSNPMGNSVLMKDGSCWIADRDSGTLYKIDKNGFILVSKTGFKQPTVTAIHQGAE
jgi:hypothetical protein